MKIKRILTVYNNSDDSLADELDISFISFDNIKTLFVLKENDPLMYDSYEIDEVKAIEIGKILPFQIFDFSQYSYFIEVYSVE